MPLRQQIFIIIIYGLNSSFDHTRGKTVTFLGIIICIMMGFLFDCTVYGNCFEFYHNCHMHFLQSHRWFNFFSHDFYILVPFDCTTGNCSEFDYDIMGSFLSHIWKLFRMKKSLKTNNYLPISSLKRVHKFLNESL